MLTRRSFLALGSTLLVVASARPISGQGETDAVTADRLRDPGAIGSPRAPRDPLDNDPTIIAIEKRLRCTCGCTLDIYTCRTTDFSCTFSPALHREILGLYQEGQTPETIVAALVEREGPQMLMAPPAAGINLIAGYLFPGIVVATAGLLLIAWLLRGRESLVHAHEAATQDGLPEVSALAAERLRRALDEVES